MYRIDRNSLPELLLTPACEINAEATKEGNVRVWVLCGIDMLGPSRVFPRTNPQAMATFIANWLLTLDAFAVDKAAWTAAAREAGMRIGTWSFGDEFVAEQASLVLRYPVILTPAEQGGFVVAFPDVPEAITQGDDRDEALLNARGALETALMFYTDASQDLPVASEPEFGQETVTVPRPMGVG